MIVLGVVLVLVAAAVGVGLIGALAQITPSVELDVPGGTLSLPPVAVLVTGMVLVAVFWLGWVLLRSGVRRNRRQRAEAKEVARAAEVKRVEDEKRTKEEFAARERQLVEERRRHEEDRASLLKEADERAATVADRSAASTGSERGHASGEASTSTAAPRSTGTTDRGDPPV